VTTPSRPTSAAGRDVGLRALVAFHEHVPLGATASVVRVVDRLSALGWTISGWLPDAPAEGAAGLDPLAHVGAARRPLAFSLRGWQEHPGVRARLRATPAYLRAFESMLLRERPHLVHANTLLSLPEALVARRCGLPVVLQVHELPAPGAKRRATLEAARRSADVLVAVSDAVAEMLTPHAGRTPVHVVRNGVEPASAPTRGIPRAGRARLVGTLGTVSHVKGTDLFAQAAADVATQRSDVRFLHAGHRDLHRDAGLDAELEQVRTRLPDGVLRFDGFRPAREVLAELDVYVSASRSEAFPLAILEAMAAGLPVVATAVGGVPEQIEDGVSGLLVPAEDAAALARAIVRVLDDPALAAALGAAAADRVRGRFTLDDQAAGLHRAYLTALTRRFGTPRARRLAGAA
jgi:glycosyltransferase involved in cell wall biosynthesis